MPRLRTACAAVLAAVLLAACGSGSPTRAHVTAHVTASGSQHGYLTPYGLQPHSPTFGLPPTGVRAIAPAAPQATVEMYDTIVVSTVPHNPFAVAGYIAGSWPTFGPLVAAFPHAYHVPITPFASIVIPRSDGPVACLDIEPGDALPYQAGAWDQREIALGVEPCDYTDLSEMPLVRASIAAAGIARAHVLLWLALWTYHPGLVSGYDAVQWTDHALGRNLDESTVTLAFLGVHPSPAPSPALVASWKRALAATDRVLARVSAEQRLLAQRHRYFAGKLATA